jgi:hypothetical protein
MTTFLLWSDEAEGGALEYTAGLPLLWEPEFATGLPDRQRLYVQPRAAAPKAPVRGAIWVAPRRLGPTSQ